MDQTLVLLVSLVLMSCCRGQEWMVPKFCSKNACPQYKLIEKHQDFEVRRLAASDWITTNIESSSSTDVVAANSRLKEYCKRQNDAGYEISLDTWPVLISVSENQDFKLSWFVPPGTKLSANTDSSVTLQHRPETTVYIRSFGGTPSIESGTENANKLWKSLDEGCTDLPTYSGAGYESYFSLVHHNEIWINADDINCKKAK